MQKRLSHSFYAIISLPSTAMGFALCIQISALSWLLSTRYHLDISQIGIVWAAGPLAGIFGQVIIGVISDEAWFWGGRRRPFILIGGTLAALMVFLLPHIDAVSRVLGIGNLMVVAVIIALTLDLSINIGFNPTRSLIADLTPEGDARTRGYTWMQTISGFWGVVAYVIGATLGNYVLISAGAVIVFAFSVLPMFFIAEQRTLSAKAETEVATSSEWGQLWRIYLAHGFSWLGVQSMFIYIIAFIGQHIIAPGTTQADASAQSGPVIAVSFLVLNSVGFVLPALVLEPLARKIGRVTTQAACVAIMAAGYFLIAAMARTPMMLYMLMGVVGIGWGAIVSLPFAIMSDKVDKSRMGFFMGIFNLSVVLPQLVASLAVGRLVLQATDKNVLFLFCGACLAISAALWLLVKDQATTRAATGARVSAASH
ncbi:MAG: MFS transporter [Pseudomonadota bacterium]